MPGERSPGILFSRARQRLQSSGDGAPIYIFPCQGLKRPKQDALAGHATAGFRDTAFRLERNEIGASLAFVPIARNLSAALSADPLARFRLPAYPPSALLAFDPEDHRQGKIQSLVGDQRRRL